jgi:hypothetical protein
MRFWHKLYNREHNTGNVLLSIILEALSKFDEVQYKISAVSPVLHKTTFFRFSICGL